MAERLYLYQISQRCRCAVYIAPRLARWARWLIVITLCTLWTTGKPELSWLQAVLCCFPDPLDFRPWPSPVVSPLNLFSRLVCHRASGGLEFSPIKGFFVLPMSVGRRFCLPTPQVFQLLICFIEPEKLICFYCRAPTYLTERERVVIPGKDTISSSYVVADFTLQLHSPQKPRSVLKLSNESPHYIHCFFITLRIFSKRPIPHTFSWPLYLDNAAHRDV